MSSSPFPGMSASSYHEISRAAQMQRLGDILDIYGYRWNDGPTNVEITDYHR